MAASNRRRKGKPRYLSPETRAIFVESGKRLSAGNLGRKQSADQRRLASERMKRTHAEGKVPHKTPAQVEAVRRNFLEAKYYRDTKPELAVKDLLDVLGASYEREVTVGDYRVDFLVEGDRRFIVEVFGCWWHGCPHKNPDGQWLRDRDAERLAALRRRGYEVIVLWEHDLDWLYSYSSSAGQSAT